MQVLRLGGLQVEDLHHAGRGVADVIVRLGQGAVEVWSWVEFKRIDQAGRRTPLTPAEKDFAARWPGRYAVIATPGEAQVLVELLRRRRAELEAREALWLLARPEVPKVARAELEQLYLKGARAPGQGVPRVG